MNNNRVVARKISAFLSKYIIFAVFLLLFIIMAFSTPVFLSMTNLMNVLLQISTVGIIAIGMTFVIITQCIDVSVGSILALASICGVYAMKNMGVSPILGILIILAVAIFLELFNGVFIAYLNMPAFIVTLAMMQIARGLAQTFCAGRSIYDMPALIKSIGNYKLFGIPLPIFIFILCAVIGYFILSQTIFGKKVYAIGGNPHAANVSGISVQKTMLLAFLINGLFVGMSSVVLTGRMNSFYPDMGTNYEFDAIAAAVIGGSSLAGGVGTIQGTIIGVCILGIINNSLNLLDVTSFMQLVFKGLIIFIAVLLDTLKTRKHI